MIGTEKIGNYDVRKIGNDKYCVASNNGHYGVITNKADVEALKEKYNPSADSVEKVKTELANAKSSKGGIGKAVASYFLPGLGQILDGRKTDGKKDMIRHFALPMIGGAAGILGYLNFAKVAETAAKTGISKTPYGFYAGAAVAALAGIGSFANWIHSVVDAYKGGK